MTELWYGRGTRTADEIQREIHKFWAELETNDELRKELVDAGIDPDAVAAPDRQDAIQVSVRGAGIDPGAVSLIVAFVPAASEVLISLWNQVLLPRIRNRYGRDAIRDERPPEP